MEDLERSLIIGPDLESKPTNSKPTNFHTYPLGKQGGSRKTEKGDNTPLPHGQGENPAQTETALPKKNIQNFTRHPVTRERFPQKILPILFPPFLPVLVKPFGNDNSPQQLLDSGTPLRGLLHNHMIRLCLESLHELFVIPRQDLPQTSGTQNVRRFR